MEPWLDSLSDEWISQPRSSSPAGSVSSRQFRGSVASNKSQSRIPHLAQSIRKESHGGYLRPRSQRGLARSRTDPVLSERSASSLNLPPSNHGSQKRANASTLPRRASSAFSDSQNSVQHHTIADRSTNFDTPDWKKRLANGENVASDGFDLFAPSKLEGIFNGPISRPEIENEVSLVDNLKTWKPFDLPAASTLNEQYQSMRASRSRPPGMEVLQEVDEEEAEAEAEGYDFSAISSDVVRDGSLRGLVRQRVRSLERGERDIGKAQSPRSSRPSTASGLESANDPRWRTLSGRQELENEFISPITASKQNTIRDKAVQESMDVDLQALDEKLAHIGIAATQRPSSSSSDRRVPYGSNAECEGREEASLFGEVTSNSLPDDLSMGTQDFISRGGFVNKRRGAPSGEVSYLRRTTGSREESRFSSRPDQSFRSSPPPYTSSATHSRHDGRKNPSLPSTPNDNSVVHHDELASDAAVSGSPLKLFSNKDTYTNNKLLRILSQYDDVDEAIEEGDDEDDPKQQESTPEQNPLRMSQFGQGEIDKYPFDFEKEVSLSPGDVLRRPKSPPIFTTVQPSEQDVGKPQLQGLSGSTAVQSPIRSPKRRRTLIREEIQLDGQDLEFQVSALHEVNQYAGKKRTDAKPGSVAAQADPSTLASRTMLHPKSSRKSSTSSIPQLVVNHQGHHVVEDEDDVTEALAAELAMFAQENAQNRIDSRKPSLATKDYMEEANKVMQLIRNRGKPKLPENDEQADLSELDPDRILDLDIDDESTKDAFSRPPSREGPRRSSPDRRHAVHDEKTASYLRRYQEDDDLEVLANTSALGALRLSDNDEAHEASQIPISSDPEEQQESSPPNMRILNLSQSQKKRKHSASTAEGQVSIHTQEGIPTQMSNGSSSQRTFPTSSSSGNKGMITSGTVNIPDQIGTMTFDHRLKTWVSAAKPKPVIRKERVPESDADPFEHIPDLSIDEQQEEDAKTNSRRSTLEDVMLQQPPQVAASLPLANTTLEVSKNGSIRRLTAGSAFDSTKISRPRSNGSSAKSEISAHEARLHNGLPSQPPPASPQEQKKARSVTIAFSSPLVSAVKYPEHESVSDATLEEEDDLPLDDSILSVTPKTNRRHQTATSDHSTPLPDRDDRYEQYRAMTWNHRPISRISERDEEDLNDEKSLIHIPKFQELTPASKSHQLVKQRSTRNANSSILCLTPLSEFSLHQIDHVKHPEDSFVEERANPKTLRQAHGSLALALDALVKAITDTEPSELYWEQIRMLRLEAKSLTSLHGLDEYCTTLEELSVINNQISQLNGVPASLRVLDIQGNAMTSLAGWTHLQNLQYLDLSNNQLENLDCFSCLTHLRRLVANDNQINNVDGILDLNGLLELQLCGNDLSEVDFESCELVRLTKLDLSSNRLVSVRGLAHLPKLEDLNLSHNALEDFAGAVSPPSSSVQKLDLSHNALTAFDLYQFPNLESLDLDNNALASLESLQAAYHLTSLSIRSQSTSSDLISTILGTPNEVRSLYLSSNVVCNGTISIPPRPQHNARVLELATCGITSLPNGFGDLFPNLRNLNLNFNAIKDLTPLQGTRNLKELRMARNRIKKLRRTCLVLSRVPSLEIVDLRDNPLTLGMYAPDLVSRIRNEAVDSKQASALMEQQIPYELPPQDPQVDQSWKSRMDDTTRLKRRMLELLLAEGCPDLSSLNGLKFVGQQVLQPDSMNDKLAAMGVLVKPAPLVPTQTGDKPRVVHAQELPDNDLDALPADDEEEVDGNDSGVDVTEDRVGVETYADDGRIEPDLPLPLSAEETIDQRPTAAGMAAEQVD